MSARECPDDSDAHQWVKWLMQASADGYADVTIPGRCVTALVDAVVYPQEVERARTIVMLALDAIDVGRQFDAREYLSQYLRETKSMLAARAAPSTGEQG